MSSSIASKRVRVLDLEGNYQNVSSIRDYFIRATLEFSRFGEVSQQIPAVDLLLMDSTNNVYLRKTDVGLSTTLDSPVYLGDDHDSQLRQAFYNLYQTPLRVVAAADYEKELAERELSLYTVVKKLSQESIIHPKLFSNSKLFRLPMLTTTYVGRFDGELGNKQGVQLVKFLLEDLCDALRMRPQLFTPVVDLIVGRHLVPPVPITYH